MDFLDMQTDSFAGNQMVDKDELVHSYESEMFRVHKDLYCNDFYRNLRGCLADRRLQDQLGHISLGVDTLYHSRGQTHKRVYACVHKQPMMMEMSSWAMHLTEAQTELVVHRWEVVYR